MEYNKLLLNGNIIEEKNDKCKSDVKLVDEDIKAIRVMSDERQMFVANFEDKKIAFYTGNAGKNSVINAFMTFDKYNLFKISVNFIIIDDDKKECARYHLKLDNGVFKLLAVSRLGFSKVIDREEANGAITLNLLEDILRDALIMVNEHSYYNKVYPFDVNNEMILEIAKIPEIEREIVTRLEDIKNTSHNAIARMELQDFLNSYKLNALTRTRKKD